MSRVSRNTCKGINFSELTNALVAPQLTQDIQIKNNEAQREARKKEKLERDLRMARTELDNKHAEVKTLHGQIDRYKQDINKTESTVKEQKVKTHEEAILGPRRKDKNTNDRNF